LFLSSSGPGLFCEIFDCDHNKITAHELVQSYFHTSIKNPKNDPVIKFISTARLMFLIIAATPIFFYGTSVSSNNHSKRNTCLWIQLVVMTTTIAILAMAYKVQQPDKVYSRHDWLKVL
jgi:hypothetical protein